MNQLKNIYLTASGLFAAVPGITILITNLGVPDGLSRLLVGGIVESTGTFTLLLMYLNKEKIKVFSISKVNRLAVSSFVLFLLFTTTYITLYNLSVVDHPFYEPVFFPLWSSGDLTFALAEAGSRYNAVEMFGKDGIEKIIESSSQIAISTTNILFIFLYQGLFLGLVSGFALLGIKYDQLQAVEPSE